MCYLIFVLDESADIDECVDRKPDYRCAKDAICKNTEGNYTCTCPPNFSGDGTECNRDNPRKFHDYLVIGTVLNLFEIQRATG